MESKKVLFSIVCPTFNRSKLLRRAIDSALRQQLEDFELIIVNDGSTDDTRDLVSSCNDERIIYIEHEKNMGLNAARNTGFNRAKGKYIVTLDDDDELSKFALQMAFNIYNRLSDGRIKVLFFNCINVESRLISGKSIPGETIIRYEDLLCEKLRGDYWVVVERSILPEGSIFEENLWGSAGILWSRLLRNFDGYYVPKIAYFAYRKHELPRLTNYEANSKNLQIHENRIKMFLREFGADTKLYCPKVYSKQIATLAFYQLLNKNFRQARLNLILSLKNNFSVYVLGLLALTFIGNEKSALFVYERLFRTYFARIFF